MCDFDEITRDYDYRCGCEEVVECLQLRVSCHLGKDYCELHRRQCIHRKLSCPTVPLKPYSIMHYAICWTFTST